METNSSGQANPGTAKNNEIRIRTVRPEDLKFIYSTFLKGVLHGCQTVSNVDRTTYFAEYSVVIDAMLSSDLVVSHVAHVLDDENFLVGYILAEPATKTVHWVYTKELWRKQGVCRELVTSLGWVPTTYSHETKPGRAIAKKKTLHYNPFVLKYVLGEYLAKIK